jgi:hypothetical protein
MNHLCNRLSDTMLKQGLFYLLLSILVVVFAKYAYLLIVYISMLYTSLNVKLIPIFAHTGLGVIVRKIILLVLIPVLLTLIPALIYRLVKGKEMPYLIELTWCLWLVIVISHILVR